MKDTLGFTVIPVKTGIQGVVRLAFRIFESGPLGVTAPAWVAVKLSWAELPKGSTGFEVDRGGWPDGND
jgi:hypothetical protein